MREYVQPGYTDALGFVFESFAAGLARCTPDEIRSTARHLSEDTRQQLAWYCLEREHLKAIGREIAAVCFETNSRPGVADEMAAWSQADFDSGAHSEAA
jgi:hypothetical protein